MWLDLPMANETNGVNMTANSIFGDIAEARINQMRVKEDDGTDATWILTSAFIIFTMQNGFGLLEAGSVSVKNEANIMVKNAVDVIFGGLGFWICGYAISFGRDGKSHPWINGFMGYGNFFLDSAATDDYGNIFAQYFFQLSFATTATTIVSGAMAERANLKGYMLYSFINLVSYSFPAHWIFDDRGFLRKRGVIDIAGCAPVHLVGGTSALVATLMLKPRNGIFDKGAEPPKLASPTNMILGTFMLWWGWLGFNCGSTFGISGCKWKLAARTAVITMNGSIGGAIWSIIYSYKLTKIFEGKLDLPTFVNGILAGLVSITSICAICRPFEALFIGFIGGIIVTYGDRFIKYLKIDDPVSCISVHGFGAIWGMLVVGLVAERETEENINMNWGVIKGGPVSFLGYQCLACVCTIAWAGVTSIIELFIVDTLIGIRMDLKDEKIGADLSEHGITHGEDSQCLNFFSNNELDGTLAVAVKESERPPEVGKSRSESSSRSRSRINSGTKYGLLAPGLLAINSTVQEYQNTNSNNILRLDDVNKFAFKMVTTRNRSQRNISFKYGLSTLNELDIYPTLQENGDASSGKEDRKGSCLTLL